jgi:hypothetical protein
VSDDATVAAVAGEFRFANTECLSFTLASFAVFSFGMLWGVGSPVVLRFSFLASFVGSFSIHASPPSSHSSRRIQLKLTEFLAVGSDVSYIAVKGTFLSVEGGIVLSVLLSCLKLSYLEMRIACKTRVVEE